MTLDDLDLLIEALADALPEGTYPLVLECRETGMVVIPIPYPRRDN